MPFNKLPLERANRLINHGPTILVSAAHGDRSTVMTAAWCMPASHTPPMVAVAIVPKRFTHELILASSEFVVNIPGADMLEAVMCCGTISGRKVEKFSHCGLTSLKGSVVGAPLIDDCLGALECRLVGHPQAGDHSIIIGEVVAVWARPGVFDERLLVEKQEAKTLHHLGGRDFALPGEVVRAE